MAVLFRPKRLNQFGAMAGVGHEDQFASHTLSARCWIRKETIAGGSGNDEDAPMD